MLSLPKYLLPLAFLFAVADHAAAAPPEDERARNAVRVLSEIQKIPEQAIPDKLLDEARAIVVVPDTIKAGLVLGGRRGHGLLSVKGADGTWSNPVFVTLTFQVACLPFFTPEGPLTTTLPISATGTNFWIRSLISSAT